jgi:hypothetical protein
LKRGFVGTTYEDKISLAQCKELGYRKAAYLANYPHLEGKKTRDILNFGNERETETNKADFTSENDSEFTGNYAYTEQRERETNRKRREKEEKEWELDREIERLREKRERESHPDDEDDGPAPQEER